MSLDFQEAIDALRRLEQEAPQDDRVRTFGGRLFSLGRFKAGTVVRYRNENQFGHIVQFSSTDDGQTTLLVAWDYTLPSETMPEAFSDITIID